MGDESGLLFDYTVGVPGFGMERGGQCKLCARGELHGRSAECELGELDSGCAIRPAGVGASLLLHKVINQS